ncbi:hypothetical protein RJ639_026483 [Escallonia herrerae]|uniref:Uncharacterized protein n=1 Tax=Escallonia herrerae TaxID=1293975 RepID=A0AA88UXJ9_9ASTE|nr:hypothetical protein RJ639_026483 [Escallonia herrerae]
MEEEKAAAYYDELTRKGGAAAKFKQGLGFSSSATPSNSNDAVPSRGSALPSSSFLNTFVKASSPSKSSDLQKESQLHSIQNKLQKKSVSSSQIQNPRVSNHSDRETNRRSDRRSRSPSRSRDKDRYRRSKRRSRSRCPSRDRDRYRERDRDRYREKDRDRERRKRRSRSRSISDEDRRRLRGRGRARARGRSRSLSPRDRTLERKSGGGGNGKERNGGVDYAKLIDGYDTMTPAERVKAKMKLQLSETAEKDDLKSTSSGWERFDFDKDAPLDDEEIEVAEDDADLVKHIGQSFRFSAVEAKREEKIKDAHDEAMFGSSSLPPVDTDSEVEGDTSKKQDIKSDPVTSLISDQVLTMQQGSWRDRARK